MSITDTWPTEGLKKYSERLKQFIHQRYSPCTPTEDELFEVPEFMKLDPLIRRPSKYKLSFADDFPYTRFKDDSVNANLFCCCNVYTRNRNLNLASHVLKRDELPKWILRHQPLSRRSDEECLDDEE